MLYAILGAGVLALITGFWGKIGSAIGERAASRYFKKSADEKQSEQNVNNETQEENRS